MNTEKQTWELLAEQNLKTLERLRDSLDRINTNVQEFNENARKAVMTIKKGQESNPALN